MTDKPVVPGGTLDGKVIFITGASQGIGLVSARAFAAAGAKVILSARRGEVVRAAAAELERAGHEAIGLELDVTDEAGVIAAVAAAADRFGRIDGLFNNAGIDPSTFGNLDEIPLDEWRRIHAVKIDGTFLCTKHVVKVMLAQGGNAAIVNNGSSSSVYTPAIVPAASTSQAAIIGMTRSAAVAYGPSNIRTNMLLTGYIVTEERANGIYKDSSAYEPLCCPLRRGGRSEDVAQVAAWLLSDYSAYVNGAVIPVEGGATVGSNPPGERPSFRSE